jgi:MoxR-like ATPase
MAESSVTIDGTTHALKPPFLIVATQNPVDHEGTFPLPEAQLDRFLIKLSLGYPALDEEAQMLEMLSKQHPLDTLQPVATAEQLVACQRAVRTVHVDEKIRTYITQLVHATREHHDLSLGGSPRASIALYRTAQAVAAVRGRGYVEPDDVKHIAQSVLAHRLILRPEARLQNVKVEELLTDIMDETQVPLIQSPARAASR